MIFDDTKTDIDQIKELLSYGGYRVLSVEYLNTSPIPEAGVDLEVLAGEKVTLDGSASFDPDGDELHYQWAQTAGTPVELEILEGDRTAVFTAPDISDESETLVFSLHVMEADGFNSSDDVHVTVHSR